MGAGNMPAIVGTEQFSWVELVQEHETENNPKSRFNLEGEEEEDEHKARPEVSSHENAPRPQPTKLDTPERWNRSQEVDDEPMWPTYLGLALFLILVLSFSWMQWGPKAVRPEEL